MENRRGGGVTDTSFVTQGHYRILHTGKIQSRIVSSSSSDLKETFSDARSLCDGRDAEAERGTASVSGSLSTSIRGLSPSKGAQGHAERIRQFE